MSLFNYKYRPEFKAELLKSLTNKNNKLVIKNFFRLLPLPQIKLLTAFSLILIVSLTLILPNQNNKPINQLIITANAQIEDNYILNQSITYEGFGENNYIKNEKIWYDPIADEILIEHQESPTTYSLISYTGPKIDYYTNNPEQSNFTPIYYIVHSKEDILDSQLLIDNLIQQNFYLFKNPKFNAQLIESIAKSPQTKLTKTPKQLKLSYSSNNIKIDLFFAKTNFQLSTAETTICNSKCTNQEPISQITTFSNSQKLERTANLSLFTTKKSQLAKVYTHSEQQTLNSLQISPPTIGKITQDFHSKHQAIDIRPKTAKSHILSSINGSICEIKASSLTICSTDNIQIIYKHIIPLTFKLTEKISQNQSIGQVATTNGEFFHFEVKQSGINLNPLELLKDNLIVY